MPDKTHPSGKAFAGPEISGAEENAGKSFGTGMERLDRLREHRRFGLRQLAAALCPAISLAGFAPA
jgi:hypothetical protein